MSLRSVALGVARSRAGAVAAGLVIRGLPWAVPGRLATSSALVMMKHPRPIADGHRLAVTRQGIHDVRQARSGASRFWTELAAWCDGAGDVGAGGFLVTNFGQRQEVRLLHVHVLSQPPGWAEGPTDLRSESLPDVVEAVHEHWSRHWGGRTGSVGFRRGSTYWQAQVDLVD